MATDIMQPVGEGCPNIFVDVKLIQQMLNRVPGLLLPGSKYDRLVEDGKASALFVAALNEFQKRSPNMVLETKKVMPGGPTVGYLNAYDSFPPLTRNGTAMCPHGGSVKFATTGKQEPGDGSVGQLAVTMIMGCPFMMMMGGPSGPVPSPCTTVRWMGSMTPNFIDQRTVGLCIGQMGMPQGNVIIANTGTVFL